MVVYFIVGWLLLGVLGLAIFLRRWYEVFGDLKEIPSLAAIFITVFSGPIGFIASVIHYFKKRPKEEIFTINVNGVDHQVMGPVIDYAGIRALAYPKSQATDLSCTFHNVAGSKTSGILHHTSLPVYLKDGAYFCMVWTGNA